MELARNPSDQNIENWIAYNKKKNDLNQRLQKRVKEFLVKNSKFTPDVKSVLSNTITSSAKQFDPARYRVRMFFDSKCPHCKRMFSTLLALQEKGIYVEALQVDEANFNEASYPIPIRRASVTELKKHKISAVPVTLIADLKKKVLYPPVRGYQDVKAMTALINEGERL